MNTREKLLLVVLIAILGLGIGGYLTNENFVKPLRDANNRMASLQNELDDVEFQLAKFIKEKPKLDAARKRSLPSNPELAVSTYNIEYLQPLLRKSGLTVDSVTPSNATEMKLATPIENVKKTNHKLVTFQVRARGDLSQLVDAIRSIQATPYEHRIKNVQIDRADAKDATKLAVNMMVEILLVANADRKKADPPPAPDLKLLPDRNYDDIAKKNIFAGLVQPPDVIVYKTKKEPVEVVKKDETPVEPAVRAPEENVPSFVHLVTTEPETKTAYLRNIVYRTRETKLIAKPGSGYEYFKVTDEVGDYVYFKAKIMRVDQRDMYFQVKNQVYRLRIGSSLEDAIEAGSLSIEQIEDADLFDLYQANREWAKKEMDGEDAPAKTPAKKGRTR